MSTEAEGMKVIYEKELSDNESLGGERRQLNGETRCTQEACVGSLSVPGLVMASRRSVGSWLDPDGSILTSLLSTVWNPLLYPSPAPMPKVLLSLVALSTTSELSALDLFFQEAWNPEY